MAQRSKKLLVYSQDGLGLGHQRRTSRIVNQLLRIAPEFSVVTLCDSPLGQIFHSQPGHEYIKIPTLIKVDSGVWRTIGQCDLLKVIRKRQEIMFETLDTFLPDIFLVDHMPQGALGELLPIVEKAKRKGCKVVLGLRDILDLPGTIIDRWQKEDAYTTLQRFYDHVLIYGQQDVFDTRSVYQIPSSISSTYCGYVSPCQDCENSGIVKEDLYKYGNSGAKVIVVTFGGGADAAENLQLISQSLANVSKRFLTLSVMIAGPFNPAERQFKKMPTPAGMKVIRNTNNMLSYMLTADLIVSMAGYNTIVEILYSKTKALIIPRNGPSLEQQMRAQCLKQLGLLDCISYKNLTPVELSEKICLLLNDYTLKREYAINLNGAFNAANVLREM